jgi:D-arabinose 5-phosphate isomerase GutQ
MRGSLSIENVSLMMGSNSTGMLAEFAFIFLVWEKNVVIEDEQKITAQRTMNTMVQGKSSALCSILFVLRQQKKSNQNGFCTLRSDAA